MRRSIAQRFGALLALAQILTFSSGPVGAQGSTTPATGGEAASPQSAPGWDDLRQKVDKPGTSSAELKPPVPTTKPPSPAPGKSSSSTAARKVRKDFRTAWNLAGDPFLFKMAAADPGIIAAICEHPWAAWRLTHNRHLGDLAECDHYLCRRLTRWSLATWSLIKSPQADRVIALDPEGIYRAIDRNPMVGHCLSKNVMFNNMVTENPDLGKFIATHM